MALFFDLVARYLFICVQINCHSWLARRVAPVYTAQRTDDAPAIMHVIAFIIIVMIIIITISISELLTIQMITIKRFALII